MALEARLIPDPRTPYPTARSGWRTVRFGDVVRNVDDSEREPLQRGLDRYVGLEHLDPDSLHIRRWGSIADGTSFSRRFSAGQVLFGKRRAYQRKAAMAEFDGICSGDILVFEAVRPHLLPELLPFIVQSDGFVAHALQTSAGSLSPRTKWRDLATYEFALPPLDEQRRIAEILWAADAAIERLRDSESASERVQEVLLDSAYAHSAADEEISLGDVGTWSSGGTPSRARPEFWQGPVPWASPKDMKVDVLHSTEESVSQEAILDGSRLAPEGAIFVVVRGMILAHTFPIALAGCPMAFNQDMKALVVSDRFHNRYIFYWLKRSARRILSMVSDSSHGTKRISTEDLFRLAVPAHPWTSSGE